jgi:predicted NBD/HSP70 family sugar kinase
MTYVPGGSLCRCGRHGCIEAYAGSYAIWRRATGASTDELTLSEPPEHGLAMIADRARAVDGPERQAFREAGLAIGTGLANLFAMIDPFPVALVGPGVATLDLTRPAIMECMQGAGFGQPFRNDMLHGHIDQVSLICEGGMMRSLIAVDAGLPEKIDPGLDMFSASRA